MTALTSAKVSSSVEVVINGRVDLREVDHLPSSSASYMLSSVVPSSARVTMTV